ncbi:electron transfer flavoprotein subunit alpha/FixB family protein [Achromobacter kerstersii]|uniref:electron transfer flavoprotein subunit alpha/FixB family protein n=1 Tax=Achromobacter kerstersii TaxID=1353890 RepID=UPI001FDFAFA9|nr:electron transfer flavoprotein subunit alpha/FixB family protein [Achromobacter kerstersii]
MMNAIRRLPARRPHTLTAAGIKRIVLERAQPDGMRAKPAAANKPLRTDGFALRAVLAVAHSDRGQLDAHARQAIAAAALLAQADTAVHLLVFGELDADAAHLGVDALTLVPSNTATSSTTVTSATAATSATSATSVAPSTPAIPATLAPPAYAPDVELAILLTLIDRIRPMHIFLPDNGLPDGDLGRRLAAATRDTVATHVVALTHEGAASAYSGNTRMQWRALSRGLPRIVLLAPDVVDERLPFIGHGKRAQLTPLRASSAYRDHGTRSLPATEVDLQEADLIVAAGNGVRDLTGFQGLADALGAAVGASRVAVDDGRFPRSQQIGATGKTVSASAYLAFGISGAVQHLQGIKDCRHVIAVNLDASAPLVRRADLSIIDDTQSVAQALLAEVQRARAAHPAQQVNHD